MEGTAPFLGFPETRPAWLRLAALSLTQRSNRPVWMCLQPEVLNRKTLAATHVTGCGGGAHSPRAVRLSKRGTLRRNLSPVASRAGQGASEWRPLSRRGCSRRSHREMTNDRLGWREAGASAVCRSNTCHRGAHLPEDPEGSTLLLQPHGRLSGRSRSTLEHLARGRQPWPTRRACRVHDAPCRAAGQAGSGRRTRGR